MADRNKILNVQNTKAIARKVDMTTAAVNEVARDLNIKMNYREDNRYWEIADRTEAVQLMIYLASK